MEHFLAAARRRDEPLKAGEFERMARELWDELPEQPATETVRVDGVYAEGEPDHDDAKLAVGDRVRVSYANSGILKLPPGMRPYYNGTVRSVEPWDESLAGMVFVHLDHLPNPEHGAWWERGRLRKVE